MKEDERGWEGMRGDERGWEGMRGDEMGWGGMRGQIGLKKENFYFLIYVSVTFKFCYYFTRYIVFRQNKFASYISK